MKKAMILVAFVSFSAFANASNLSVKRHLEKVKPLIGLSSSQGMKSAVTVEVKVNKKCGAEQWQYSYTCGGVFHAACCYASQQAALDAGNAAMACDAT